MYFVYVNLYKICVTIKKKSKKKIKNPAQKSIQIWVNIRAMFWLESRKMRLGLGSN